MQSLFFKILVHHTEGRPISILFSKTLSLMSKALNIPVIKKLKDNLTCQSRASQAFKITANKFEVPSSSIICFIAPLIPAIHANDKFDDIFIALLIIDKHFNSFIGNIQ